MLASSQMLSAVAIVLGSALVAGAIFSSDQVDPSDQITIQRVAAAERHIYGNPNASTIVVEFSDYECPFCSRLHPTLKSIVDESAGEIAWEYRHLPLRNHPLAAPAAAVSECVHNKVGNAAFWQFSDALFENQRQLSNDFIAATAQAAGVTNADLEACSKDASLTDHIATDTTAAAALGGSGTPFSVIIYPDNTYKTVAGAVPREQWDALLDIHAK